MWIFFLNFFSSNKKTKKMDIEKILQCSMCNESYRHTLCRYSLCHVTICDNCGEEVVASLMDQCRNASEVIYTCHAFAKRLWHMKRYPVYRERCLECNTFLSHGVNCTLDPIFCDDCKHRDTAEEIVYSGITKLSELKEFGMTYVETLVADKHRYNDPRHFHSE